MSDGFRLVDVLPSPNAHAQPVAEVDWSMKLTPNGAAPLVGLALKPAVGGRTPTKSVYTIPKLSSTTTLPIVPPALGIVPLSNCEIANEPTADPAV